MFGLGFGEIAIILVVALLVLGPSKLPELARGLGKGLREFRKATEDFKSTIDGELYKPEPPRPAARPAVTPGTSEALVLGATTTAEGLPVPTADPTRLASPFASPGLQPLGTPPAEAAPAAPAQVDASATPGPVAPTGAGAASDDKLPH